MQALLISFLSTLANETGDKTQLVALCLATQFRRPRPVLLGILAAVLVSNLAAALLGGWLGHVLTGKVLDGLLALSFLAAAVWALIPDKLEECPAPTAAHGIFLASFTAFLLAEMGDKTQLSAAALSAYFGSLPLVLTGTTLGMMAANLPVVLLGDKIMARVPLKTIRLASGAFFAVLGIYELTRLL